MGGEEVVGKARNIGLLKPSTSQYNTVHRSTTQYIAVHPVQGERELGERELGERGLGERGPGERELAFSRLPLN